MARNVVGGALSSADISIVKICSSIYVALNIRAVSDSSRLFRLQVGLSVSPLWSRRYTCTCTSWIVLKGNGPAVLRSFRDNVKSSVSTFATNQREFSN